MAIASPPRPTSPKESVKQTDSARRGGCPQDKALYECACGKVFTATVSTSVGCPTCGSDQAW